MPQILEDNPFDPMPLPTVLCLAVWQKVMTRTFALRCFRDVNRRYRLTGDVEIRPNVLLYTPVIQTLARSGSERACLWAEKIFVEMRRRYTEEKDDSVRPNELTYCMAMLAVSRINQADAPLRAQTLLEQMVQDDAASPFPTTWPLRYGLAADTRTQPSRRTRFYKRCIPCTKRATFGVHDPTWFRTTPSWLPGVGARTPVQPKRL